MDLTPIVGADMLRGLTQEDVDQLGSIASERRFERKDCVFRRGEASDTFYVASGGGFALTVALPFFDRSTEIAVEELGPLDAFGWSSLVKPQTSIYSAYCIEDGAVVAFRREPLEGLMAANQHLGARLLQNLSELIGARVRLLQDLWLGEVSQSMGRVQHWMGSELTSHWASAMSDAHPSPVLRWMRRHRPTRASD